MNVSHVGERCYSEDDLLDHLMVTGELGFDRACTDAHLPHAVQMILDTVPTLEMATPPSVTKEEYDHQNQLQWFMPDEYKEMDIAKYVLDLCQIDMELQRVGQELLLYQERGLFGMLKYLKYLVDVMRDNDIIWGVGRGSSTASYVLFLIGVHRINSIYYDLPIDEFLR